MTDKAQIFRIIGSLFMVLSLWFWSPLAAVLIAVIWALAGEFSISMAALAIKFLNAELEARDDH